MGEIGNGIELIARVDVHPRQRHLLDDGATLRHVEGSVRSTLPVRSRSWTWSSVMSQSCRRRRHLEQGLRPRGDLWKALLPSVRWLFKASRYSVWVATSSGL